APGFTNGARLPLVLAMTCLNGFFHSLFPEESLAEALVRAPNGGAIAVWASSSLTTPGGQAAMDRELFHLLFTGAYSTLGEAVAAAKKAAGDPDVRRSWILFGDPAIRLKGLVKRPPTESRPRDSRIKSTNTSAVAGKSGPATIDAQRAVDVGDVLKIQAHDQPNGEAIAAPVWQMVSADLNHDGL